MKYLILSMLAAAVVVTASGQVAIYKSDKFSVYDDRVVQGKFQAKVTAKGGLQSNYVSPAKEFQSPKIDFKFSINGKDNEMVSGKDHHFVCLASEGICETPLIEFGKQLNDKTAVPPGVYLKANTVVNIRLDMRKVFSDFQLKGYYETFNGSKIYREDFKGVYVAGGTAPLTWDFDNLQNFKNLELHDDDGDHIYELKLTLNETVESSVTVPSWRLTSDVSAYPKYKSSYPLVDAIYNLSLEEMIRAVEKDSTLRTGKSWAGVWTRDVSYSIILSMAILQEKVAKYSLLRKVKNGMIVQDTGTGGAYPISTDRMIWAVAAWEIYKVSGDREWLKRSYPIIKKSLEADLVNTFDARTGLVKGESSFLDWREQTYPDWMQPADIFESQCLGTNAVHFQAHMILAMMADELNDSISAVKHREIAEKIRHSINNYLWVAEKKYYGQFLYGRTFDILSAKSEALGEALTVLYDIADASRQKEVVSNTPVGEFGISCIYPQIPNIPPYHNNAVWPFVESYWALAAAKAGNEESVLHSMASIWRPAAMFLTNKENFVASTGDYASTQINSDNMLWSLSGNIAMIYKVLFGIHYNTHSLEFRPFVPKALAGKRSLKNFRYRSANLDISLSGFGNRIKSIRLDGKDLGSAVLPESMKGNHKIEIVLADNEIGGTINMKPYSISPEAPIVKRLGDQIWWNSQGNNITYRIIDNGKLVQTQADTLYQPTGNIFHELQVVAVSDAGLESFASEPVMIAPETRILTVEAEHFSSPENKYAGFSGVGYIKTDINGHRTIDFTFPISEGGMYAIDFRYANGNGPVNTGNKCAIRSLLINDKPYSTVVLPQRGKEEWSDWGYSNAVVTDLPSGDHKITLTYSDFNANMNGEINEAVIDYIRIVRID